MGELGSLCLCKVKVRATCPCCKEALHQKAFLWPQGAEKRWSFLGEGKGGGVLPGGMATHTTFRETVAFCGQSRSLPSIVGGGANLLKKKKSKARLEKTVSRANCRSNNWDLVA